MAGTPQKSGRDSPIDKKIGDIFDAVPPPTGVTRRDALYVQNRLKGLSPLEAYRQAGFHVDTIAPCPQAGLAEKRIMQSEWVKEMAAEFGLNLPVFFLKMAEGLDATTQKEYKTKDDEIISGDERVDFKTRAQYLKMMGDMLHITRSEDQDKFAKTVNNTVNILQIGERYRSMPEADLKRMMQNTLLGVKIEQEEENVVEAEWADA